MVIFFKQLEVDYVLFNPPIIEEVKDFATVLKVSDVDATTEAKYDKENKMVRGHMLSHMPNNLFDPFVKDKSAKSIWGTLEKKYGVDDVGIKTYDIGEWLKFQMTDDEPMMEQVHTYHKLVFDILAEGIKMCEILQANVLIEKLQKS
ncbi:ty1-copia retrotransposon protein [Gossypium australe]|uniref:Ty1-copia retrotransposon protein n=1 Tax=Gossypium australe TaxID=47621 RepID=A0A5B6ULE1_9ROSI|nr:ty1-copia retrotransposon protein [Gossypium australe]